MGPDNVIKLSVPNETRVAGYCLAMESLLKSRHTIDHVFQNSSYFQSNLRKALSSDDWILMADIEAVLRVLKAFCMKSQSDSQLSKGLALFRQFELEFKYRNVDSNPKLQVVDV